MNYTMFDNVHKILKFNSYRLLSETWQYHLISVYETWGNAVDSEIKVINDELAYNIYPDPR